MSNDAKITLVEGEETTTVDVYSEEGLELVSKLWVKLYAQYKLTHDVKWMGIPIIQFPEDIMMMQELIWKERPDIIVECGIAHGGSLVFYASLFELIGKGRVIGVDVEIRKHNRAALDKHPMKHRIEMIEESSVSERAIIEVKKYIKDTDKVMVVLDSNHSKEHVLKELAMYSGMVTPGSYIVTMDGAREWAWNIPDGKPEWKEDNPLKAIEEFTGKNKQFVIDPRYNRLRITSSPKGFLKKLTLKEIKEK
ncbi:cephalosporin hydroxylase family protein [bacterium]|nr:hydroxylase [Candidatus Omnitrophota bacterium]MBU3929163.1 cephalosporin hydroxylase family protein [bacterium]MBU4122435.1 cephalosporin hydroxylase family protein [bacterium]